MADGNQHTRKIMADDVKKPGAEVKHEKILVNSKHHKHNTKRLYNITKLFHKFSDVNTALLNYDSVQARSNSTSPNSNSATTTRNSPTQNDKVTNKNNLPTKRL